MSLLIVAVFNTYLSAQTSISGVINQYARVNSIGDDYVIIDDDQFDQFAEGDTVLLMQMKGARIWVLEDPNFYGVGDWLYGKPGYYEFLTILSVDDGTNTIEFRNNIINTTFNVIGNIQLIKVPSYNYAIVDSELTCQPWDSAAKTGGVLAAIIGRTLSLNANINVTGKGLKGGTAVLGEGICMGNDLVAWDKFAYQAYSDSSGNKGEGLAILSNAFDGPPYLPIYPGFAEGKGANFTGGGGGNGKFSGGGGGSNYGLGAKGGREIYTCSPNYNGGLEGKDIASTGMKGGMFMGGGGGGSTYTTGIPVPGGNGGGMIFLICDTLMGNGYNILAEGELSGTASGNAGAGGGGGGGSIALYLQSYSDNTITSAITISANGGHGGNNAGNAGEGGGGGGGYINTTDVPLPANVIKSVSGGTGGTRSGTPTGLNGLPGTDSTTFIPLLNGFLFNSIVSSVTGNQIDSICSNVIPEPIIGTSPVGGSGTYNYLWQKSYDLAGSPIDIVGSNTKDYVFPDPETDTLWIRRIVEDDVTFLTDTSKWVNIIVQPAITGNLVGKDTTICFNQDPLNLVPINEGPSDGNGIYRYQWIQSLNADMTGAASSPGTSDQESYDPPALTDTTYFKRIVISGRCVDQSSAVTITVLPSITGNITDRLEPDSIICEGSLFNTLGASAAGGGSDSYEYLWQDSTASGIWANSPNINNTASYTPDTLEFATIEQRYYRRVVFSGPDSVCRSNSSPILMTRYHYIENNTISKDTTICSGIVPPAFAGTTPEKGSTLYTYMWQDSSKAASWTTQGTLMSPYSPPVLTDTTWYRRIVNSSKCADTSNILVINVHKPIENNISSLISASGSDTTICSGAVPNKIKGSVPAGGTDIPGDYAYQWYSSPDNSTFTDIPGANNIDYQPEALTVTTWFKRKVISGKCFSESNTIEIIVLTDISDNIISSDQTVCYGTTPAQLTGTDLTGGAVGTPTWIWEESDDGINWAAAEGTGDEQNYSPPALTDPIKYRRIILSGPYDCCADTSEILEIGIHPLPTGEITSVIDTICNGTKVLLNVTLTGAQPWKLVYSENSTDITVDNISNSNAVISRVPEATAAMSSFSYSLVSVEDDNGCIAASPTGTRKAVVYRVPVAEAGPDDEVCGPEYTLAAVPSDGTGTWYFPPEVKSFSANDPNSIIKIDSSFTDAGDTLKFYWEETNWQCTDKDSVTIIFYNRIDKADAGSDTSLFSFDYIMQLHACPIKLFETGKWSVVAGTGDFDNDTLCSTNVRNISMGKNTFKWVVTNGVCMLEDMIDVTVYDLMIPEGFSPNNDPENYNNAFIINGLDLRKKLQGQDSVPAYQIAELTIVNGAGTRVFTTTNRDGKEWKNWDGKNSEGIDMPEGTYYYLLKITSIEVPGQVFKKSGFIILKRY